MMVAVKDRHGQARRRMIVADAHKRAIERRKERGMTTTQIAPQIQLTPMQIGILKRGVMDRQFKLERSEAGKSSGYLVARGLIKPTTRKGVYTLTEQGRAAYTLILEGHAQALDITAMQIDPHSGLNLNDAALMQDPIAALADRRQKRILQLEKTIDDLGEMIDQRDARIEALIRRVETLTKKKGS